MDSRNGTERPTILAMAVVNEMCPTGPGWFATRPLRLVTRLTHDARIASNGWFWQAVRDTFILWRGKRLAFRRPVLRSPEGFLPFFQSRF